MKPTQGSSHLLMYLCLWGFPSVFLRVSDSVEIPCLLTSQERAQLPGHHASGLFVKGALMCLQGQHLGCLSFTPFTAFLLNGGSRIPVSLHVL